MNGASASPNGASAGTFGGAGETIAAGETGAAGTAEAADETISPLVEEALLAELPVFETFFKTFGFKRVHGRVWGLLVLGSCPVSSKEIASTLGISQGATSATLNELTEWGAVSSRFDNQRRCHLHAPVGNALTIVATVFRRREQVVFQQFRQMTERSLNFIRERHGDKDPRVLTLRSILTTCDIGEAVMQLVFSAVQNAMTDPASLLSRAVNAAFKVGVGLPARVLLGHPLGAGPVRESDLAQDTAIAESAFAASILAEEASAGAAASAAAKEVAAGKTSDQPTYQAGSDGGPRSHE
ncbi:MAG: DNA-binding transcriptional regulator GbsR (MarR family) [Planctomycetota bacterium]|jgi:DNA-binding transcriptional regulator GbsR (MarR family)